MKVILVDGSGFLFRAYFALPKLTRSDGWPIGAVHGYCSMIWKLLSDNSRHENPATHIGVLFDKGKLTWRNEVYPAYKLNRQSDPTVSRDITPQFKFVRQATRAFGLPSIEIDGYEADDLIATYTRLALEAGAYEVIIVSSDKDMMQFIGPKVCTMDTMKETFPGSGRRGKIHREADVIAKFGVTPDKVIDAQALIGDLTDNVPGVPGIGKVMAAKLVNQFGDLESIIANIEKIDRITTRALIKGYAEQARISRRLVEMDSHVPVVEPLEALEATSFDVEELSDFLDEMEFTSLRRQIWAAVERGYAA